MVEGAITRLYAAATGEDSWQGALDDFRVEARADCLFLGLGDPQHPDTLEAWMLGTSTAAVDAGFRQSDVWDPSINLAIPASTMMPVERSFDHRSIIPEEASLASDFMRKTVYDTGYSQHRLFVALRGTSVLSGGFISRGKDKAFEPDDVGRLDHMAPHLGRAMRMRHQLARHRTSAQSLLEILDRMRTAVFLLDRDCTVLFRNARAERLIEQRSGVVLSLGRLSLGRRGDPLLANAITRVADFGAIPGDPPVIAIRDDVNGLSLVGRVYPGTGYAGLPGAGRAAAALLIETPDLSFSPPDIDVLRHAFGLTRAEALVAQRVPSGDTRRGIADALGLSPNTVKTHLASIRAKTGADSQIALARMLQQTAG